LNHRAPTLSPSADDAAEALDLIFIEGFRGDTVIGIHDTELHRPQPIVIDLAAGVRRAGACDTDRIGDTIDYGVVRERLRALMLDHGVQLLEALAERIATLLIEEFGAQWARVKVVKPRKFDDVEAVGVQIERWVGQHVRRETPPQRSATLLHLIGSGMVPPKR
jgi:7,8-dihydroneopterin aldolase/epimerase/oxygenase